jgi:hypothetical protein
MSEWAFNQTEEVLNLWSLCNASAARSPMITQCAMVFP